MKLIRLLFLLLLSVTCIGQVYKYEIKETRQSKVWTSKTATGYVSVNENEIAITEGNVIKAFTVTSITPFGHDYMIYNCIDEKKLKVKIIVVLNADDKSKFKLLVSYPSKYYRYYLDKM